MGIGILALLTNKTAEIITISVMGALTLYFIAMLSLLRLRKNAPNLPRPFSVPGYPLTPIMALLISVFLVNIKMFINKKNTDLSKWILFKGLILQFILMVWTYQYTDLTNVKFITF
jgi:ethanolamine permease